MICTSCFNSTKSYIWGILNISCVAIKALIQNNIIELVMISAS